MFFDPIECKQAEDYLRRGALIQAAQVLIGCRQHQHRKVQQMLLQVQQLLIKEAEELCKAGDIGPAREHLELATRCGQLPAQGQVLYEKVSAQCRQRELEEQWQRERIKEAEKKLQEGHLQTAADLVAGLSLPEARPVQEDIDRKREQLARYVSQGRKYLDQGNLPAARECYRKARQIAVQDPEVINFAETLARQNHQQTNEQHQSSSPIVNRNRAFKLDSLGLVFSSDEITVGRAGAGATLPLWGKLRVRQAILARTRNEWQLIPCCDSRGRTCRVWVDGAELTSPMILQNGQQLEFAEGSPHWRFSRPMADSATAFLEAEVTVPATPFLDPADQKRIILLADKLVIAAQGPAHLVVPNLPCEQLCFSWSNEGLIYEVAGGRAATVLPDGTYPDEDSRLVWTPSQIVFEEELDEAEWLGRVMTSSKLADNWNLPIIPVG